MEHLETQMFAREKKGVREGAAQRIRSVTRPIWTEHTAFLKLSARNGAILPFTLKYTYAP